MRCKYSPDQVRVKGAEERESESRMGCKYSPDQVRVREQKSARAHAVWASSAHLVKMRVKAGHESRAARSAKTHLNR